MRRFEFITGAAPVASGEGVQFDDGSIVYRHRLAPAQGGTWTEPVSGSLEDITYAYGDHPYFKLTWLDKDEAEKPKPVKQAPKGTE